MERGRTVTYVVDTQIGFVRVSLARLFECRGTIIPRHSLKFVIAGQERGVAGTSPASSLQVVGRLDDEDADDLLGKERPEVFAVATDERRLLCDDFLHAASGD